MKAIIHRLRRLEGMAASEEMNAAAEAILEARRRRLGADYKPTVYPAGWFDGCCGDAEHIIRARVFLMGKSGE